MSTFFLLVMPTVISDANSMFVKVWGFETINGERYHTRRVVCANNGEYVLAKLVYTFVPPSEQNDDDDIAY